MRRGWLSVALVAACMTMGPVMSPAARATTLGYDPKADPFAQYHDAIDRARSDNKLVLVIAGGDWCRWCHVLNKFVARNADVEHELEQTFVVVKVYVGDENYNETFFSQLPAARGAPHFWIISPDRHVLGSQSTGAFEHGGNGYDKGEFLAFIDRWRKEIAGRLN
jgi:Thioredoxin-like